MQPPHRITEFRNHWAFLSNFFIEPDVSHVEGEFQAAKCANPLQRESFRGLAPGQAKKLGRAVTLRADWDDVKLHVMEHFVRQKFTDHWTLKNGLLQTADAYLEEGNYWHDCYWGCCYCAKHQGQGQNMLGHILMQVRQDIRTSFDYMRSLGVL